MTDFEKGAEAMREACATLAHESDKNGGDYFGPLRAKQIRDAIRLLPLPVQPPGSESREAMLERELAALKEGVRGHQRAALEAENTRLNEERRAVVELLLDGQCDCDEEDTERCTVCRVLAALNVCGHLLSGSCGKPKGHKGEHNRWWVTSDNPPLRPPDARPPSPDKQRGKT